MAARSSYTRTNTPEGALFETRPASPGVSGLAVLALIAAWGALNGVALVGHLSGPPGTHEPIKVVGHGMFALFGLWAAGLVALMVAQARPKSLLVSPEGIRLAQEDGRFVAASGIGEIGVVDPSSGEAVYVAATFAAADGAGPGGAAVAGAAVAAALVGAAQALGAGLAAMQAERSVRVVARLRGTDDAVALATGMTPAPAGDLAREILEALAGAGGAPRSDSRPAAPRGSPDPGVPLWTCVALGAAGLGVLAWLAFAALDRAAVAWRTDAGRSPAEAREAGDLLALQAGARRRIATLEAEARRLPLNAGDAAAEVRERLVPAAAEAAERELGSYRAAVGELLAKPSAGSRARMGALGADADALVADERRRLRAATAEASAAADAAERAWREAVGDGSAPIGRAAAQAQARRLADRIGGAPPTAAETLQIVREVGVLERRVERTLAAPPGDGDRAPPAAFDQARRVLEADAARRRAALDAAVDRHHEAARRGG